MQCQITNRTMPALIVEKLSNDGFYATPLLVFLTNNRTVGQSGWVKRPIKFRNPWGPFVETPGSAHLTIDSL